ACKDLKRNGQNPAITLKAAYVPAYAHNALTGAEGCV
ncbi:Malolactic regulator, partial [Lactobacillus sp. HMSC077C11]